MKNLFTSQHIHYQKFLKTASFLPGHLIPIIFSHSYTFKFNSMKNLFSFIGMILFSVSLMGQTLHIPAQQANTKSEIGKVLPRIFTHHKREKGLHHPTAPWQSITTFKSFKADKQRLDSILVQVYDNKGNDTINFFKEVFTFDAKQKNIQFVTFEWNDSLNIWNYDDKADYTYNAAGKRTQSIYSEWDMDNNTWVGYEKEETFYDANGKDTLDKLYSPGESKGSWNYTSKTRYFYDANGRDTLQTNYSRPMDNGTYLDFEVNGKTVFMYDDKGRDTLTLSYQKGENSDWEYNTKDEYAYDENGNLTEHTYCYWDYSRWVNNEKDEYTYDTRGNLTDEIYTYWDMNSSQWVPDEKDGYIYDMNYTFQDLILPLFEDIDEDINTLFGHKLTKVTIDSWEEDSARWISGAYAMFYYSAQSPNAVINPKSPLGIQIFPNPASDYILVQMKNNRDKGYYEIFNLLGKKVLSGNFTNGKKIPLQSLKSGIYMCRFISGEKSRSVKLKIR
jgi:hypothetical protein